MIKPRFIGPLWEKSGGSDIIVAKVAAGTTISQQMIDAMLTDYLATGEVGLWMDAEPIRVGRKISEDAEPTLQIGSTTKL